MNDWSDFQSHFLLLKSYINKMILSWILRYEIYPFFRIFFAKTRIMKVNSTSPLGISFIKSTWVIKVNALSAPKKITSHFVLSLLTALFLMVRKVLSMTNGNHWNSTKASKPLVSRIGIGQSRITVTVLDIKTKIIPQIKHNIKQRP